MNEFNLKKKQNRTKAFQKKDNILSQTGFDLIKNKLQFINKKFEKSLFLDEINEFRSEKLNQIDLCNFEKINKNNIKYDGIFSNFSTQIDFAINLDLSLITIYNKLLKDGLFCFNLLTPNSMRTIKKIFMEIDENVFNGVFDRFGPFHDIPEIIERLNQNNFKEIVVGTEIIELNYGSFDKLREDFKEFGISNYNVNVPKFKKEFLIKTYSIFNKIIEKYNHIPVEFEIATFTSWK